MALDSKRLVEPPSGLKKTDKTLKDIQRILSCRISKQSLFFYHVTSTFVDTKGSRIQGFQSSRVCQFHAFHLPSRPLESFPPSLEPSSDSHKRTGWRLRLSSQFKDFKISPCTNRFTDLPLVPDKPIDIGVQDFCESCGVCAQECPGKATSSGKRPTEPASISNNRGGLLKWPMNADNCFKAWSDFGVDCTHCIAICPKNKPPAA